MDRLYFSLSDDAGNVSFMNWKKSIQKENPDKLLAG